MCLFRPLRSARARRSVPSPADGILFGEQLWPDPVCQANCRVHVCGAVGVGAVGRYRFVAALHVLHRVYGAHTHAEHFSNVYFMFPISDNVRTARRKKTRPQTQLCKAKAKRDPNTRTAATRSHSHLMFILNLYI